MGIYRDCSTPKRPGCFFLLWPLFARAPRHWFLENFLLSAPGVQSVFFFVALRWAPRPFGGARAKKKTPPRVFVFLLLPRGKAGEGEAPLGAGTGPEQKKEHHPGFFFFAPAPGKGRGRRSTVGRRHGARAKSVFFFCSGPVPAPNGASPSPAVPGAGAKKKTPWVVFFFCSGPVPAPNGASPSLAFRRGRSKKNNTLGGVFFFALAPCRRPTGLLLPVPFAGAAAKKTNTLGGVFFFCCCPARTGGDASPSAGWCLFFCCGPARTGVVFFFLLWPRPDAHSLTVGWGDFGKARVVFFFLLRPRRAFLDNNKKCLGYYIGSKKTRRGHSKKKNTTSHQNGEGLLTALVDPKKSPSQATLNPKPLNPKPLNPKPSQATWKAPHLGQ